ATNNNSLVASPDGKLLAAGRHIGTVLLYDAATGKAVRTLDGHTTYLPIYALAFSPDGSSLVSCAADSQVICWDVATGKPRWKAERRRVARFAAPFSPDGKQLALVERQKETAVCLVDVMTGQELRRLPSPDPNPLQSASFAPDGKVLAAGSPAGAEVYLFELASGKLLRRLGKQERQGYGLVFAPGGGLLASLDLNGQQIRVWDPSAGALRATVP